MTDVQDIGGKPATDVPGAEQGVDINAAMKAFRDERAKDLKEDAATAKPPKPEGAKVEGDDAKEAVEPKEPAAEVEVSEKDALKTRLRSEYAAKQRALNEREAKLAAQMAETQARYEAIQQQQQKLQADAQRYERLEQLRRTDHRAWLKETGVDLKSVVRAELAATDPTARQQQAEERINDIPSLIEKKVQERLEAYIKDQEAKRAEERRVADVQSSHKAFVSRITDNAEEFPTASAMGKLDPDGLVHVAYYVQNRIQARHHRMPTNEELDAGVEYYLSSIYGKKGDEGPGKAKTNGKATSPKASAKETSDKPVEEMSEEERMRAALAQFRKDRSENDSGLR